MIYDYEEQEGWVSVWVGNCTGYSALDRYLSTVYLEDGEEIGFALFFHNFSTFLGKSGLYLEDLFIHPEKRGKGVGTAVFRELARIARERGYGRMEWSCLNWNESGIQFYYSLGAEAMSEWTVYRLTEDGIAKLAGE